MNQTPREIAESIVILIHNDLPSMKARTKQLIIEALEAERQRCEGLREYVEHKISCNYDHPNPNRANCDCGLEDVISPTSAVESEEPEECDACGRRWSPPRCVHCGYEKPQTQEPSLQSDIKKVMDICANQFRGNLKKMFEAVAEYEQTKEKP